MDEQTNQRTTPQEVPQGENDPAHVILNASQPTSNGRTAHTEVVWVFKIIGLCLIGLFFHCRCAFNDQ